MRNRIVKSALASVLALLLLCGLFSVGALAAPDQPAGETPPAETGAAANDDADLFIKAADAARQSETVGNVFAEAGDSVVRSNGNGEEEPDFVLPSSLTEIGEEAFAGSAFRYAALSEQTESIGSKAFAECPNLAYVRIPNGETVIEADAFDEGSGLTIIGVKGSGVETYARAHNFTFRSITGEENNTVLVTFITAANTARLSALGSTTTVNASGTTFRMNVGTVVTVTSATTGYNNVILTAQKGVVSANTYTVPEGDDLVLITLVNTSNLISVNVTGGALTFRNAAGTVINAAETGEIVTMTAVPADGYRNLTAAEFSIVRMSDGKAVSVTATGTGWYFTMPAGGVYVTAQFSTSAVQVTFRTSAYTARLSALGKTTTVNTVGATYNLYAGTVITVTSATSGYNDVVLTAGKGIVSGNTYTVPDENDYVLITLVNSGNPIRVSATNGTLTFRNAAGAAVTAAETGETVTMTAVPDAGYESLNISDFTIKRLSDGSAVSVVPTTAAGWSFVMPAGGVQVNAEFRSASSVQVIFATTAYTAKLSALGGETTVDENGKAFYAPPGTVVTITSATPNYKVATITAQKGSVSGNRYTVPNGDDRVVITLVPDSTTVSITFSGQNGAYRLTMNGDTGVFTGSRTFYLEPGSIVNIMPETSGYDYVWVQSTSLGQRSGTYVNYTVPATSETVTIWLI